MSLTLSALAQVRLENGRWVFFMHSVRTTLILVSIYKLKAKFLYFLRSIAKPSMAHFLPDETHVDTELG